MSPFSALDVEQSILHFDATYPDDAVWSSEGDLEVPGGFKIASRLVAALRSTGARCSDVYQRSFYGWEFEIYYEHLIARAVLQQSDEWLLVVEANKQWLRQVTSLIQSKLECDPKVVNVRAMSMDESASYAKAKWEAKLRGKEGREG